MTTDKRYQVFISSTFADLQEERKNVIQIVIAHGCIPAGMEMFPAVDETQWSFIQRIIDDCDYYLLIIGGRYGSTTPEGVSYTEKEYNYAREKGLDILAFLHQNSDNIPLGKSEKDSEARERLRDFRNRVSKRRLVTFWNSADELPGKVSMSLATTMATHPATGWVRANRAASYETLTEVNELRKKVLDLELQLSQSRQDASAEPSLSGLVPLESPCVVRVRVGHATDFITMNVTWIQAFAVIAPLLIERPAEWKIKQRLANFLLKEKGVRFDSSVANELDDFDFDTLKMQLMAHRLVKFKTDNHLDASPLFWSLTPAGLKLALESRTIREQPKNS